jgi:hypothetical protein
MTSSVFVKLMFRGEAVVMGPSAGGRLSVEVNGFSVGNGFSDPDTSIQQELSLQLGPATPEVVLNLSVSGQAFGAEGDASALVSIDSIDLTLEEGGASS